MRVLKRAIAYIEAMHDAVSAFDGVTKDSDGNGGNNNPLADNTNFLEDDSHLFAF